MSDQYFTGTRVEIRIDPVLDVTNADAVSIAFRKPNGTTGEWPGELFGDEIKYITQATDVDLSGTWQLQACATYAGVKKKGKICYITFDKPL
jgi:hypothetical protein